MTDSPTKLTTPFDFDAPGKHCDFIRLPHSVHRSAYGWLPLPIVSIKNGDGPTVLVMAGTHGDEYEGPIALMKLIQRLQPDDIQGRVIVIPCLNYPAVMSGDRVSPIDGVNMNRAFPGRRDGSVSEMIAHFVYSKIIPLCNGWLVIHSGGKTMMF